MARLPLSISLLALLLCVATGASRASMCERGTRQSPIDITATRKQVLPPLDFRYAAAPLKIADDGHTVRVRFGKGQELRIGNQRYALQQFHFHTPGGDRIAGEEFPMVAHLLHKSASGQLVGVAVLFRIGAENPFMAQLLPRIPARADGDHLVAGVTIDASGLLPRERGYFRYTGSLTAPPCTEGVDWIVMKQPIDISPAQLAQYRRRFADNMRAAQPLNGRVVLESR
ncbi:MAG: carbonic anhydrase [Ramlibacter sp.]